MGISRPTVYLWIKRYWEGGVPALWKDKDRPGRTPQVTEDKEKTIMEATLHSTPDNAAHWSVRSMAKAQKVSRMTVQRIWNKYNLKPHLIRTFKLSSDPHFAEKVDDVVGSILTPLTPA